MMPLGSMTVPLRILFLVILEQGISRGVPCQGSNGTRLQYRVTELMGLLSSTVALPRHLPSQGRAR